MTEIKRQILQFLYDHDDSQFHDISHITKASAIRNDPAQLKQTIAQLDNDKMILLQNSMDNRYMGYYEKNIDTYTIYCKINDGGRNYIEDSKKNWYDTANAKRQYEDYPKVKKQAKDAIIVSVIAIIVSVVLAVIGWLIS